jgi:hypothetical protein
LIFADRDFGAKQRADAGLFRGEVESGRAVNAVAVEQRHRREPALGAHAGQRFGNGSSFQEAEGRVGVKLDVRHL